jgi:23S rRNA pseudouridine1911/1915/1917 synthase
MPEFLYTVKENTPGLGFRLDRYVSENLRLLSRSQIKARRFSAKINGKPVKLSRPVRQGDVIEMRWDEEAPVYLIPENIPLDIVYEDERCAVINKAQGMVVHPGAGNRQGTLANALYFRRLKNNKDHPLSIRAGIVHRLDKDTSGLIIAAYDDDAHAFLAQQFKDRKVIKKYAAIIHGTPKEKEGRIETFIARDPKDRKRFTVSNAGKTAVTFYKVIKSLQNYSLVMLRPRTGRTHQLRVHLKHIGHPILGDSVYGYADKNFPGAALMLHSKTLAIVLPGETERRVFSSALPGRFTEIIAKLGNTM